MKTIRRIFDLFMQNAMPDDVQGRFSVWLLSKYNDKEKDKVMTEIWEEMSHDLKDHVTPSVRLRRLESLHSKMGVPARKKRRSLPWVGAAACLALFCALFAFQHIYLTGKHSEYTCLVASSGGKGEFVLPDGSHVWLNSDSKISYEDNLGGKERVVHLEGEAYFDVVKSGTPFVVDMGNVDIKVLGTSFNARNSALYDGCEVTLEEGMVEVRIPGRSGIKMKEGQQLNVSRNADIVTVKEVDPFNSSCWTESSVELNNKTLKEVLTCIEHWYSVKVTLSGNVNMEERISLKIRHEPIEETLEVIKALVRCDYSVLDEKNIVIFDVTSNINN